MIKTFVFLALLSGSALGQTGASLLLSESRGGFGMGLDVTHGSAIQYGPFVRYFPAQGIKGDNTGLAGARVAARWIIGDPKTLTPFVRASAGYGIQFSHTYGTFAPLLGAEIGITEQEQNTLSLSARAEYVKSSTLYSLQVSLEFP